MKHFVKLFVFALVLALLIMPPVAAQEDDVPPGEGGIIVTGNFGGDPNNINSLLGNSTVELLINWFIFPYITAVNPEDQVPTPGVDNDQGYGLATGWEFSDDGLTLTLTMREDAVWSDGTPITAADYKYTFDALASGETSSPRTSILDTVDSVDMVDDYTLQFNLSVASCRVLSEIDDIGVLPKHLFEELTGGDFAAINELEYNLNPTVTSGVFNFGAFNPGEQISLVTNDQYIKPVLPTGFIIRNVPDQTVEVEQFLAGEINVLRSAPPERFDELRERAANGEFQFTDWVDDGLTFMGFNLADPTNPQDGLDEEGNPIDQGNHPLFGDVRVRQAIAHGINLDDIINGAAFGEGVPVAAYGSPALWGYDNSLEPFAFDPERALELLAEAGFVDADDNPSTPLVATEDALYAEPGTEFRFTLRTNAGNLARESSGTIIQDQLGQLGIQVDFEAIDFGALVEELLGQEYDAIIIGFTNLDQDADGRGTYTPSSDTVGGGFNFVSYNNPEVTRLYQEAVSVPGCDADDRAALTFQAQAILAEELPWLPLYSPLAMRAARNEVQNWSPFPENEFWNMSSLVLSQ
jgi:peptide/nickel transport system substrate-binding protein